MEKVNTMETLLGFKNKEIATLNAVQVPLYREGFARGPAHALLSTQAAKDQEIRERDEALKELQSRNQQWKENVQMVKRGMKVFVRAITLRPSRCQCNMHFMPHVRSIAQERLTAMEEEFAAREKKILKSAELKLREMEKLLKQQQQPKPSGDASVHVRTRPRRRRRRRPDSAHRHRH